MSLLASCGEEYKAKKADRARWQETQAADSLDAYLTFVETYPESAYLDAAKKRMNDISGAQAREELKDEFGGCVPDDGDPAGFKLLYFGTETLVDLQTLRDEYRWDDTLGRLWKWHESQAGFEMPSGSMIFLANDTIDPASGIAYTMGFGGKGFGTLCIDNLQVYGVVSFPQDGLLFSEGSVLIYPK